MESSEEKFFEQLAKGTKLNDNDNNDNDIEIGLAKAETTAPSRSRTNNKKIEKTSVEEAEEIDLGDEPEGQLTIDVYQTPNDIVIESAIAGVNPEDLDVNVSTDSITIRGSRHRDKKAQEEDYLYQECYWGRFSRSVILPQEVDPDGATVTLKNGILTVRLPKINRKKTKKLKVKVE